MREVAGHDGRDRAGGEAADALAKEVPEGLKGRGVRPALFGAMLVRAARGPSR